MATKTEFRRWYDEMGYENYQQAADALGISVSHVNNLISGWKRGTGVPARPPKSMRVHMNQLWILRETGGIPAEWPADK